MATPKTKPSLPSRYQNTGTSFKGGFGEVIVVRDLLLDRDVALKTIDDTTHASQLRSEIIGISEVRSKHVVQIYDLLLDRKGNVKGVFEEYIPGSDLTAFATEEPYGTSRFLAAAYQIASGIADIHQRGLVHRDVKLNNMKRDAEGIIKLFDFGLSCAHRDHETLAARGTLVYAAPELYAPPLKIDKSLDTYAFGISCWFLATGTVPAALLETPPQKTSKVSSIVTAVPDLPPRVVTVIDAALNTVAGDRPSMSAIREVFQKQLLFGLHHAWLTGGYQITNPGQAVSVGSDAVGKITIKYDGLRFYVSSVVGSAFVNNKLLSTNDEMPGSCVITIGDAGLGASRKFVEFHISHPEVVL